MWATTVCVLDRRHFPPFFEPQDHVQTDASPRTRSDRRNTRCAAIATSAAPAGSAREVAADRATAELPSSRPGGRRLYRRLPRPGLARVERRDAPLDGHRQQRLRTVASGPYILVRADWLVDRCCLTPERSHRRGLAPLHEPKGQPESSRARSCPQRVPCRLPNGTTRRSASARSNVKASVHAAEASAAAPIRTPSAFRISEGRTGPSRSGKWRRDGGVVGTKRTLTVRSGVSVARRQTRRWLPGIGLSRPVIRWRSGSHPEVANTAPIQSRAGPTHGRYRPRPNCLA